MPDGAPDGRHADMKITNITASSGTIYYYNAPMPSGSLTGSFDPLAPTTNGWQAYLATTATQPIQAIAVVHGSGTLCQEDGMFTITVQGEATDPLDPTKEPK